MLDLFFPEIIIIPPGEDAVMVDACPVFGAEDDVEMTEGMVIC